MILIMGSLGLSMTHVTLRMLEQAPIIWQPESPEVGMFKPVIAMAHDKQTQRRQRHVQARIARPRITARTVRRACTRAQ